MDRGGERLRCEVCGGELWFASSVRSDGTITLVFRCGGCNRPLEIKARVGE